LSSNTSGPSDSAIFDEGLSFVVETFESQRLLQENIVLVSMQGRVADCVKLKDKIKSVRETFLELFHKTLKKAADLQTYIHKLKKRIEMMARLYKGNKDYFARIK